MSPSDPQPNTPTPSASATVTLASSDGLAELMLLDSNFNPVARGFGALTKGVTPGMYVARALYGPLVEQSAVAVRPGKRKKVSFASASIDSPIPISRSQSYVPAHAEAVVAATDNAPAPNLASFLLCVRRLRTSQEGSHRIEDFGGFTLIRPDHETVADFNDKLGLDLDSGIRTSRADLAAGEYYLAYTSKDRSFYRVLPLVLVPGWRLEFYITVDENGPDFIGATFALARTIERFQPQDVNVVLAELVRAALLRDGSLGWKEGGVPEALLEKNSLHNPLLAVLALHLVLRLSPDSVHVRKELVETLLSRARTELGPTHPDVWALEAKVALASDTIPPPFASAVPPMVLLSWSFVLDAADRWPGCVDATFVSSTAAVLSKQTLWTSLASTGATAALPWRLGPVAMVVSTLTANDYALRFATSGVGARSKQHIPGATGAVAMPEIDFPLRAEVAIPGIDISLQVPERFIPPPALESLKVLLASPNALEKRDPTAAEPALLQADLVPVLNAAQLALRAGAQVDDVMVRRIARSAGLSVEALERVLWSLLKRQTAVEPPNAAAQTAP